MSLVLLSFGLHSIRCCLQRDVLWLPIDAQMGQRMAVTTQYDKLITALIAQMLVCEMMHV